MTMSFYSVEFPPLAALAQPLRHVGPGVYRRVGDGQNFRYVVFNTGLILSVGGESVADAKCMDALVYPTGEKMRIVFEEDAE